MKSSFITISFLLSWVTAFGQYHYIQKLGNLGSIALPDSPKLKQSNSIDIYILKYNGVIFMAQAGNISDGISGLFRNNNIDSNYNGYVKGLLKGSKGKLFYKNKIKINNYDGIELGYKGKVNGQEVYRYHRAVILNDTLLMCGIWSSDSLSHNDPNLNVFFKGFKTKSKEDISSANAYETGRKIGRALGVIIILGILGGIGFSVVFLIKKVAYRNKR